jgi:molecular chaperone DnaK (HSP70)
VRGPQEASALVLREMREAMEAYLARKPIEGVPAHVDRAVITVPAHFNEVGLVPVQSRRLSAIHPPLAAS